MLLFLNSQPAPKPPDITMGNGEVDDQTGLLQADSKDTELAEQVL